MSSWSCVGYLSDVMTITTPALPPFPHYSHRFSYLLIKQIIFLGIQSTEGDLSPGLGLGNIKVNAVYRAKKSQEYSDEHRHYGCGNVLWNAEEGVFLHGESPYVFHGGWNSVHVYSDFHASHLAQNAHSIFHLLSSSSLWPWPSSNSTTRPSLINLPYNLSDFCSSLYQLGPHAACHVPLHGVVTLPKW